MKISKNFKLTFSGMLIPIMYKYLTFHVNNSSLVTFDNLLTKFNI